MTLALVFVSRCKLYLFYLRFKNTEILLPSLDLAAAWENVGEVKSAVSELFKLMCLVSILMTQVDGWVVAGARNELFILFYCTRLLA